MATGIRSWWECDRFAGHRRHRPFRTEARIVAGPRVLAIAGGGDAAGLAAALEAIVARKPAAILSFGVAGGLAPGLAPGSKLIARTIIAEDGTRYDGDPVWSKRLSAALGGAMITDIAGIEFAVGWPRRKARPA